MMRFLFFPTFLFSLFSFFFFPVLLFAQEPATVADPAPVPQSVFARATVLSVDTLQTTESELMQRVTAKIHTGAFKDEQVSIDYTVSKKLQTSELTVGETIVIVRTRAAQGETWFVVDHYRLPALFGVFFFFLLVAFFFARKKAVYAVAGLGCSLLILAAFIVPQIAQGRSPFLIGMIGSILIVFLSLFIAHGFHKKTTIAFIGITITLFIATLFAMLDVHVADIFGFGSDAAYDLQFFGQNIDLKGLLLAGIIIGTLGVLDDVATSLVATIHELYEANPKITRSELYLRGMTVGREHIVSLINTLVLAYAGASLPLLLLFSGDQQPFWVTLNSQLVGEEIIRTLVGSIALVLAVPITTLIAVVSYTKPGK